MIIGSQGIIKKGTDKHLNKIPGSPYLQEIKKIALWGTCSSTQESIIKI